MSTTLYTTSYGKLEPYIDPKDARTEAVQVAANLTCLKGTIMGQITGSGKATPYATGNSDGSQVPQWINVYDFVSDASGNISLGGAGSAPGIVGSLDQTAEMYYKGDFLESELTGLDAGAVTAFKAREIGIGSTKRIHIP